MRALILSLFLLLIPSIYSYNCSIARDSLTCSMLPSCRYPNTTCVGTFPDPYINMTSFYIDPVNGSDIHSGSINKPFKTLENAFKALRGKDGALVILNHRGFLPIEINSQITINSSVTLKTLFEDWTFTIDLQRFDVSQKSAFKIQQGGNLGIFQGKFDSATSPKGLETVFDIEDNAQLSFNNVFLWSNSIPVTIVRSTGQNSNFDYFQGSYWNSSFTFDLQGGRHDISKVRFDEIKTSQAVFSLNHASLTIDDITVKKGNSLFIHMVDESALDVQNLTISNYNGSFLYAQDPSFINVNYSSFRDVRLARPNPFIHITGTKVHTQFVHLFNQTKFWDIYLQSSLILVDKMMTSIALENMNMNRVLQENRGYPKGICLAAENEVSVSIEKSVFSGINATCLDLDSSSLRLENNVFDNSWSTGLEKQATGSRGVTWVSLNDGTNSVGSGYLVKILSNTFKENKFAPMNGGALRFTGNFPGTVAIKNNSFTGNQAIASGGAIYCDNIEQNFEIEENQFTNNFAHVAGAIYIMNNRTSSEEEESKVSLKGVKFIKNKSYQGPVMVVTRTQRFIEENCVYEDNEELQSKIFIDVNFDLILLIEVEKRFIYDEL